MAIQLALAVGLVLAAVLLVFLAVVTYNNVIALQRRCQRAWANIDVALKQRHDQLPNLVSAVRSAMAFEEQVLDAVTRARAAYQPEASVHDQAVVSEQTSSAVRSLFATVEAYPELKSHQNVMALQAEIERLETLIARRRELFNNQVYQYNVAITTIPGVVLRPLFGWRTLDSFSAEESERERPEALVVDYSGPPWSTPAGDGAVHTVEPEDLSRSEEVIRSTPAHQLPRDDGGQRLGQ